MANTWLSAFAALLLVTALNPASAEASGVEAGRSILIAIQSRPKHRAVRQASNPSSKPFVNNHYVLTGTFPVNGYHKDAPVVVIVDKSSHFTHVLQLQNQRIVRVMTMSNAIGSDDTPTPPGRYTVWRKQTYPKWIPPKSIDPKQKPIAPYNQTHKNPLGVAAIYLNKFEIALHGTNEPHMIRQSASHGCVRHSNADIMKLYGMVHQGDAVYIVNKFRGKVLQKSDFVHGRNAQNVADQKTDADLPSDQKPSKSKRVSLVWYVVET